MPYTSLTQPVLTGRRVLAAGIASFVLAAGARADDPARQAIVVFGDSQAEGLAVGLRRIAKRYPGVRILNRTKAGTAISQAENYDWPAAIRDYEPEATVGTAVLMFGGNDRLPMHPPGTAPVPFRGQAWHDEYRARVASILQSLLAKKLRIVWVGDPVCRDPKYTNDMLYLNDIFKDVLAGTAATYLDIWTVVADADGQYAAYGKTLDGATARLRLDDGIHFTPSGYDILADRVLRVVEAPPDAPA
jgi:hypothetical protein